MVFERRARRVDRENLVGRAQSREPCSPVGDIDRVAVPGGVANRLGVRIVGGPVPGGWADENIFRPCREVDQGSCIARPPDRRAGQRVDGGVGGDPVFPFGSVYRDDRVGAGIPNRHHRREWLARLGGSRKGDGPHARGERELLDSIRRDVRHKKAPVPQAEMAAGGRSGRLEQEQR